MILVSSEEQSNKSQIFYGYITVFNFFISPHNLSITIDLFSTWVPAVSAIVILALLPNTLDRHPSVKKTVSEAPEMKG